MGVARPARLFRRRYRRRSAPSDRRSPRRFACTATGSGPRSPSASALPSSSRSSSRSLAPAAPGRRRRRVGPDDGLVHRRLPHRRRPRSPPGNLVRLRRRLPDLADGGAAAPPVRGDGERLDHADRPVPAHPALACVCRDGRPGRGDRAARLPLALARGIELAKVDYVHVLGTLVTLVITYHLTGGVLYLLLHGTSKLQLGIAGFLATVVISPMIFLGSVLVYLRPGRAGR